MVCYNDRLRGNMFTKVPPLAAKRSCAENVRILKTHFRIK
jgi:hypothetical protein